MHFGEKIIIEAFFSFLPFSGKDQESIHKKDFVHSQEKGINGVYLCVYLCVYVHLKPSGI